jgi:putative ABC transport system permease protein
MNISIVLMTAFRSLRANLGRSLLTILGIVIGIVAIVLVVALGQGARDLIIGEVESIGANTVIIRPGRQPEGPTDVAESILGDSVTDRDVAALRRKENAPGIQSVEPAVIVAGAVTYQENIFRPLTFGWTARGLEDVFQITPSEGSFFTEDDIRQRSKVALLGTRVKEELFGQSDAIGQFVKVKGHNMRVIGILPPSGQISSFNLDEIVLLPYTTAQKEILGIDYYHEIFVRTDPAANVETVAADIRATLREIHGITDPSKDDFFVWTQADIIERLSTVTQILSIFLVSIASISLVVGGVGIMNIMLVSVTERTHEIGLRKAVGATGQDILRQFLAEAIILTLAGGLIGTTLALTLSYLVTFVVRTQYNLAWPLGLPLGAISLGVGMATVVGVIFGLYPARKAAQKDPIEALRYE